MPAKHKRLVYCEDCGIKLTYLAEFTQRVSCMDAEFARGGERKKPKKTPTK